MNNTVLSKLYIYAWERNYQHNGKYVQQGAFGNSIENSGQLRLTVKSCTTIHLYILYYACKFRKSALYTDDQHMIIM